MFLFIRNLGVGEIAVVLLLALIIFGPKKLPEIGKSLGKSINEFKRSMTTEDEKKPAEAPKTDVAVSSKETGVVDSNEEK